MELKSLTPAAQAAAKRRFERLARRCELGTVLAITKKASDSVKTINAMGDREASRSAASEATVLSAETCRRATLVDREKAEQRAQERAKVEHLAAIEGRLEQECEARRALEQKVREHDELIQRYRTGAPGRPGSRRFVLGELARRFEAGELADTCMGEARYLEQWLAAAHPEAAPMKVRSIANAIREEYRELRAARS